MRNTTRALAFYLPQFHPIPENDAWWGTGFTEWRNVAAARPLFRGHEQPHIPADLGFYDLRLAETREAQAALAREYGIHGFCYYHYWFAGKRLLGRPLDEVLASGRPDFPFCLCWANENWSRIWDGSDTEILIEQTYSEQDDLEHIRFLLERFRDPRYVRVEGKPLFLVYKAAKLPDAARTTALWREEAAKQGLPGLYLCKVESHDDPRDPPAALGFDAAVEFQPDPLCFPRPLGKNPFWRLLMEIGLTRRSYATYDYDGLVENALARPQPDYLRFPCVTPSWDNSPRRKKAPTIFRGATPGKYGRWLAESLRRFRPPTPEENFVFINAWNEWAEGNHLEPCRRWGRGYLEETGRVLLRR